MELKRISLTVAEACEVTGVSHVTIYRMIADGQLHTVKARGRRLVPVIELNRVFGGERHAAGGEDARTKRDRKTVAAR